MKANRTLLKSLILLASLCVLLAAVTLVAQQPASENGDGNKPQDNWLSMPFSHEPLTIFLIHGEDLIKSKILLTLQEAPEPSPTRTGEWLLRKMLIHT